METQSPGPITPEEATGQPFSAPAAPAPSVASRSRGDVRRPRSAGAFDAPAPAPRELAGVEQILRAHLEVMVHLVRDEVRRSADPTDCRIVELLHGERRRLLRRQESELGREVRFRLMGERLVVRLERGVGLESREAGSVAWFYRREITSHPPRRGSEELVELVADAHAHLIEGTDPFLPLASRLARPVFPTAVAVAATLVVRRAEEGTGEAWTDVEPRAREILQVLRGETIARQ
jgi:hypothetical protein